jgi:hypothetical protein
MPSLEGRTHASYIAAAAILSAALAGCGSAPPPKPAEAPTESTAPRSTGPKLQMKSELGEIDPAAVDATMQRAQSQLEGCHRAGLRRVEYLGGDVKFFLRIGEDGRVKYAYFEESTLGDHDTEQCILDALEAQQWPKPQGGEAEVQKSFGFDAPGDVRAPTSWSPDKIVTALGKAEDDVKKCRRGVSGSFKVTAYVEPDGKHGKVQAVGVTAPSKDAVEKIDCLVKTVKSLKVPSPGSYAAKVSFLL